MNYYFWLLIVSTGVLGAPFQSELDHLWNSYKEIFNKSYHALEEITRRYLWEKNLAFIQKHNIEADLKKHSFKLGVNHLTDKLPQEYTSMNTLKVGNITKSHSISTFLAPENIDYPESVDWRKKGLVTEIKNQGPCGSCWAFTAVGALEGQHMRKTGKLVSLSEQNLVDCATGGGNEGCDGGMIDKAFEYIQHNQGIDTEESYPYKAKEGICHFKKDDVGATLTGWVDIQNYNEMMLLKAVATVGPIAVAINADGYGFKEYQSGVYDVNFCDPGNLNHGVLVVGYGTEYGLDYWLVKNSWGTSWGEKGYIKMKRSKNLCGIATIPSYPLV